MFGIDYSAAPPNPALLSVNGVRFACRYVSTPGNPKNVTAAEVFGLRAHGIAVVLVFETTADRALEGYWAGKHDATAAATQAAGVGLAGAPIYFAVDFDALASQQTKINAYLDGAASFIGRNRVGVYGGYWVVKRCLDEGKARYAWQTYAWSGGRWEPRAHIRQYRNGVKTFGIDCDFDESQKTDYGQSPPPLSRQVRRAHLRAWILARRSGGATWTALKSSSQWKLWRRLGGK